MKKGLFFSLIISGLLLLSCSCSSVASAQSLGRSPQALKVRLLTGDSEFSPKKADLLDFNLLPCCQILNTQYLPTAGVQFDDTISRGWATYQANNFANHLSISPVLPGAPFGTTGSRLTLPEPSRMVGVYLQSGSPFIQTALWPTKPITIRAFDEEENLLFEQATDTCLGTESSCFPKFVGVRANKRVIRTLEIVINSPYSWSLDNLRWQR